MRWDAALVDLFQPPQLAWFQPLRLAFNLWNG
jgi:hypothetical protein